MHLVMKLKWITGRCDDSESQDTEWEGRGLRQARQKGFWVSSKTLPPLFASILIMIGWKWSQKYVNLNCWHLWLLLYIANWIVMLFSIATSLCCCHYFKSLNTGDHFELSRWAPIKAQVSQGSKGRGWLTPEDPLLAAKRNEVAQECRKWSFRSWKDWASDCPEGGKPCPHLS